MKEFVILFLSLVAAGIRIGFPIAGQPSLFDVYKAMVHIFTGILLASAWRSPGLCRLCFWGLVMVEITCATLNRL